MQASGARRSTSAAPRRGRAFWDDFNNFRHPHVLRLVLRTQPRSGGDEFSLRLGKLVESHPACGAEHYHDRVLELRSKCLRLPGECILQLAALYDRCANALDPFAPERDQAEALLTADGRK